MAFNASCGVLADIIPDVWYAHTWYNDYKKKKMKALIYSVYGYLRITGMYTFH